MSRLSRPSAKPLWVLIFTLDGICTFHDRRRACAVWGTKGFSRCETPAEVSAALDLQKSLMDGPIVLEGSKMKLLLRHGLRALLLVPGVLLLSLGLSGVLAGTPPVDDSGLAANSYLASPFPTLPAATYSLPSGDPNASFPAVIPSLPAPTPTPLAHLTSRIEIPLVGIDLPVVPEPANETYPYCGVAETFSPFGQPGNGGITYIYAHAVAGMFGPLTVAARRSNSYLLGAKVLVYTNDDLLYTYEVTEIHRHTYNLDTVWPLTGEALVLQTCETWSNSGPKVLIVARLVRVSNVSHAQANPHAHPYTCAWA
jgi:sortase (surface protein transpeptidase)